MTGRAIDTEMQPEPLGDLMLDLLWEQMSEAPHVDYKLTIDISKGSDFAKTAKDIFAMANRGGGWLLLGFYDDKTRIIPVGLEESFQLDSAQLQEKFNGYASEPIEVLYRRFKRLIQDKGVWEEREFAAAYVPPSTSMLTPTKDGIYVDESGRKKSAFRRGDILTRRGTQSVPASHIEKLDIEKRVKEQSHRASLLIGKPDRVQETLFSNLLRVLAIPPTVFEAELSSDSIPLWQGGTRPFVKMGRKILSFCRVDEPPFEKYVLSGSSTEKTTKDLLGTPDGRNLVTSLLNREVTQAMTSRGLMRDPSTWSFYYPETGEERYERWEGHGKRAPRKVVRRFYVERIKAFRWRHYSVALRIKWIGDQCYLAVEPGIILTGDGRTPVHDSSEGPIITRLLYKRFNKAYYNDLRFWIAKMPRNEAGEIQLANRTRITPRPIRVYVDNGISTDRPSHEQERGPDRVLKVQDPLVFRSMFIAEPKLVFGNSREEEDPRIGLKYFGPFHLQGEEPLHQMKIGIIGTGHTRALGKEVLDILRKECRSPGKNRFLFPDFPGFSHSATISCSMEDSDIWGSTITQNEIDRIIEIQDANERIYAAVELVVGKVKAIAMEDNRPDVVLCVVPKVVEDYCGISERTRNAKRPRFTKKEVQFAVAQQEGQTTLVDHGLVEPSPRSFDLRDAIKGRVMQYNIPVQIVLERKAEKILKYPRLGEDVQDPATYSWNLSAALYYKANGKPWRLARLEQGTCYVGVAFYRRRDNPLQNMEASMAQVFTHSGDGFVLRGADVRVDQQTREPHLPREDATSLLQKAIETFTVRTGSSPSRVVIHKTSLFNEDERRGLLDAIGKASADLVSISLGHAIRFVRTGNYPVLRGTLIELSEKECLLFTSGYVPRLRTYPGPRIPKPLYLTLDCDSEMSVVASEIMKLTKINWNSTAFADKQPITIVFPRRVGKVLAELAPGTEVQGHYRFYM